MCCSEKITFQRVEILMQGYCVQVLNENKTIKMCGFNKNFARLNFPRYYGTFFSRKRAAEMEPVMVNGGPSHSNHVPAAMFARIFELFAKCSKLI